ncbi:MAG: Gfo/Idh/MocA family oxidoreductase [Bryobacterales bacterium]|nr:Gfo/Idh/MocA family oxidoreductase [Bryobacterales bacterium]
MRKLRCGIIGYGFIGPHHADAIRRLGFVEVHAICTSSMEESLAKATRDGIPKAYSQIEDLVNDPEIDVVDVAAPTQHHVPAAMAAIRAGKPLIVDKPLAPTLAEARQLHDAAVAAGVPHAVTFNYRFNPMVQQARAMVARGAVGEPHLIHGRYLQEWLLYPEDYNWRVEPENTGPAAMMGDAGCHWFDLVEYVTGLRVHEVLADFSTTIAVRKRPLSGSREAFAQGDAEATEDYHVKVPDRGTVLLRFSNGARGVFHTSALCAGHKNDLTVEINGRKASLAWEQETPNSLWIGHRDEADQILRRDPSLVDPEVRPYVALPGGHNEAWPDAFRNLMREIFSFIASGKPMDPATAKFPTFVDGLRAAAITDAMLRSSIAGGRWIQIGA